MVFVKVIGPKRFVAVLSFGERLAACKHLRTKEFVP